MTPEEFAGRVREGCSKLNGSVTSWGRTTYRNSLVGGSATSRHLAWMAMDIAYDVPIPRDERKRVWDDLGLHFWPEGDHDHISVPGPDGRF